MFRIVFNEQVVREHVREEIVKFLAVSDETESLAIVIDSLVITGERDKMAGITLPWQGWARCQIWPRNL